MTGRPHAHGWPRQLPRSPGSTRWPCWSQPSCAPSTWALFLLRPTPSVSASPGLYATAPSLRCAAPDAAGSTKQLWGMCAGKQPAEDARAAPALAGGRRGRLPRRRSAARASAGGEDVGTRSVDLSVVVRDAQQRVLDADARAAELQDQVGRAADRD